MFENHYEDTMVRPCKRNRADEPDRSTIRGEGDQNATMEMVQSYPAHARLQNAQAGNQLEANGQEKRGKTQRHLEKNDEAQDGGQKS